MNKKKQKDQKKASDWFLHVRVPCSVNSGPESVPGIECVVIGADCVVDW